MESTINRVRRIHKRTKDANAGATESIGLDEERMESFLVRKEFSHLKGQLTGPGTGKSAQGIGPAKPTSSVPSQTKALTIAPRVVDGDDSATHGSQAVVPIVRKKRQRLMRKWHPKLSLYRVVSGHGGWIRALAFDPSNKWFCSGSADRTIKIWDLAAGTLTLTLTGHISTVRGLVVSERHPYIFSCGEDKSVFCWDLEYNTIVRRYHGHLSGVYCIAMHPKLDLIVTGGRDSCARVWDIRTKGEVFTLAGHTNTVSCLATQSFDPQITTGSHDTMIRTWDLRTGKTLQRLTHHKKGVRSLVIPKTEYTFISAAADNVKYWKYPEPTFVRNFEEHSSGVINTLSLNDDGILVSGADNGSMCFWDLYSGRIYDRIETTAQPGSLEGEAGIFTSSFDLTGTRFITGEADKTLKFWKIDENDKPDIDEEYKDE